MSVQERKGMINNPSFRRSANCGKFSSLLSGKHLQTFPIQKIAACDLSQSWMDSDGLEKPVLIENVKGLGMKIPDSSTKLSDIAAIIGTEFPIKIISVGEQIEIAGNIGEYAYYLANRTADHKLLNLISLEISATRLSGKVQSPNLVREIDWIDKCWPIDRRARGDFPQVQKYCLCGMAGSYTDFHVDFGGTSVWYHVVSGQKRFYLVEPTTSNLKAFEQWTCSKTQDTVFFGDVIGLHNCYQIDLLAGQTLLIPGAWIHAVHTPLDSLVFGGNFLHSFNIVRQLQVYGMEQRTFVHKQYRFPQFKLVNWFVLCSLLPIAKKRLMAGTDSESLMKANHEENTDESSDEDGDDDLVTLCDSIRSPSVFRQFPYLVRTCSFWLLVLDNEEFTSFTKAAQEVWCDDAKSVIDLWWKILLNLADSMNLDQKPNKYRKHVEMVRDVKVFDMLNEKVIGPAFRDLNDVLEDENDDIFGSDNEADDHDGISDIENNKKPLIQDTKVSHPNESVIKIKKEIEREKPAALKIKLKLNNLEKVQKAVTNVQEEENEEGSEEKKGNEKLRLKLQIPNLTSTKKASSVPPTNSDNGSMKFSIDIGSSSVSSRIAQQSQRMRGVGGRATTDVGKGKSLILNTKQIGSTTKTKSSANRKVRKINPDEVYEIENTRYPIERPNHEFDTSNILPDREGASSAYGTRGKRVSAAFLLHAEDVDIRDIVGEEGRAEMASLAHGLPVTSSSSMGSSSLIDVGDDGGDDIPFMFDDYVTDAPFGDEDFVVERGEKKDDDSVGEGDLDEEEEESDFDNGDDSAEENPMEEVSRKRTRESNHVAPIARDNRAVKPIVEKQKRSNVKTSRQMLMAKFK